MHANHEQELGIFERHHGDGETVAGSTLGVSAPRCAGFYESIGERESAINFGTGSLLRRLRHSRENLAHAGLIAAAGQF
jgi:hypothetical protein